MSCIGICAQSSHPPHWAIHFCIIHDCMNCPLEKSITALLMTRQSTCDCFMHVHEGTYWGKNGLMHRHSSIRWTHPGSFGIFTKLNTSMCAADCSQGYKFTICFTLHPCSRGLLQQQINNSGEKKKKKWSFHKSGGEISPVVCASAWLSDCCVLASAA